MTVPDALDSFLDKWRSRWPEWAVAEVFVAGTDRDRSLAWFSLLQEFDDILNIPGDPLPADAKLGWWAIELRDWANHRSRHPLGRLLEPVPAPWAQLADALPTLVESRDRQADGDTALTALSVYAQAVSEVEAIVLGGPRPAVEALAAQVLAARLAQAGLAAVPRALETPGAGGVDADEHTARAWAGELLGHWPAKSVASRTRRIYAGFARHRLRRLAAGQAPLAGRQTMGDLWRAWRAASGGP